MNEMGVVTLVKKVLQFLEVFLVLTLLSSMVTHFVNDLILEIWDRIGTVPQVVDEYLAYVIIICVVSGLLFSDFTLFITFNDKTFRYQHWRRKWK